MAAGDILWVCGAVNSHGSVIGHVAYSVDDTTSAHTEAEKAYGVTWRWCPRNREFMGPFARLSATQPTEDEYLSIHNYLVKKGFASDDDWRPRG